jgi:glutaconate CoA-transferase subunit B
LIYESGTLQTAPNRLPLSIGDGELCDTALATVSVPEMFRYWLQGGRIDIGFLGAAQVDRFGNINTTVIGPYDAPEVRLPGSGGAQEIATSCRRTFIVMKQSRRSMVETLDFCTSFGHGEGGDHRQRLGIATEGPALLVTDHALWRPDPVTRELCVVSIHPGRTRAEIDATCGWPVRYSPAVTQTPPPTEIELATLRALRTQSQGSTT